MRESVDSLLTSGGVCGERLGAVDAEPGDCGFERAEEMMEELDVLMLDSDASLSELYRLIWLSLEVEVRENGIAVCEAPPKSLSSDTFLPVLFLPSIMWRPG